MYVYINGTIVSSEQAAVSVFDHGYLYGLGLFETFRIYEGHPFLMDDHFHRLYEGLRQMGIEWEMSKEEILELLASLLEANQLRDAYVRWNVSAGAEELGLYADTYREPTLIVYMKPLPSTIFREKEAVVLKQRRNSPEGKWRLKSHHFLNNHLAKREIGSTSGREGIFLNEEGYLAEGIVSNLFWVKNGVVYTPAVETGILNGVTRQFVLALLELENIPYREGHFSQQSLVGAAEAFMTNSIQEIVGLTACDGIPFKGEPHTSKWLQQQYEQKRGHLWSRADLAGGNK